MNDLTDQQLLRDYTGRRSEAAFAELVRRHVDFVYSAALRMVRDAHLAEDVTQSVFVAFAQSAPRLTERPVYTGWLHRTAQNLAANTVRTEVRRRNREQEATAMNELLAAGTTADWENIAPHLDAALGELNEAERDAVVLRHFESKSAREIAQILGISEEAAQRRVSRAVEHLRELFAKRGVTVGAGGLVAIITANAVQSAPLGLAVTISSAAALAGTTIVSTTTAIKIITMTTLQKILFAATLAIIAGAGVYEARQISQLREENQTLQQKLTPLTGQLAQLQTENKRLSNQVAAAKNSTGMSKAQIQELAKLRGKAQANSGELAKLKSTLAQQNNKIPDFLTNAMATGLGQAEKWKLKDAQARLGRMTKMLNLTDDQTQAISDIMQAKIKSDTQTTMALISGTMTPEQQQAMNGKDDREQADIKAQLTPEQQAAYPAYQQAEKVTAATASAEGDAGQLAENFSLSKDQQAQIQAALFQMNMSEPDQSAKAAISAAKNSGNLADAGDLTVGLQKSQLEEKVKILAGVLTPEQVNTYREEQMSQINMQASAMKMFSAQKPAAASN